MSFWKNKKLSAKEKNDMLIETCQKVFGTPEGKIVLNMLMTDLFLFEKAHNQRESFLNDYAKFFIRERLGVGDTKSITDFIIETAVIEGGYKC